MIMKTKKELVSENKHDFESLVSLMAALRGEGGCPWDREQTHASSRKCLIEETYEVVEAIDKEDPELLCEELGDLMFQAVFHAQIEAEEGRFNIGDVIQGITHKMIVRHPHVFADTEVSDSDEVIVNWDNIKKEEKHLEGKSAILRRVPPFMPALMRAQKVQGKALKKFGYGTATQDEAWKKIDSCISSGKDTDEDTITEALFALCALSEMKGIDLEELLSKKTEAFISDFEKEEAADN